jgi:hypothetical protein
MKYEETGNLTEEQFLRLTGVKRPVFENILSVLHTAVTVLACALISLPLFTTFT